MKHIREKKAKTQLSKDDFYKFIADGFSAFVLQQVLEDEPPIRDNQEAKQLMEALAEICPDFPQNETISNALYMFAAGFDFGCRSAANLFGE